MQIYRPQRRMDTTVPSAPGQPITATGARALPGGKALTQIGAEFMRDYTRAQVAAEQNEFRTKAKAALYEFEHFKRENTTAPEGYEGGLAGLWQDELNKRIAEIRETQLPAISTPQAKQWAQEWIEDQAVESAHNTQFEAYRQSVKNWEAQIQAQVQQSVDHGDTTHLETVLARAIDGGILDESQAARMLQDARKEIAFNLAYDATIADPADVDAIIEAHDSQTIEVRQNGDIVEKTLDNLLTPQQKSQLRSQARAEQNHRYRQDQIETAQMQAQAWDEAWELMVDGQMDMKWLRENADKLSPSDRDRITTWLQKRAQDKQQQIDKRLENAIRAEEEEEAIRFLADIEQDILAVGQGRASAVDVRSRIVEAAVDNEQITLSRANQLLGKLTSAQEQAADEANQAHPIAEQYLNRLTDLRRQNAFHEPEEVDGREQEHPENMLIYMRKLTHLENFIRREPPPTPDQIHEYFKDLVWPEVEEEAKKQWRKPLEDETWGQWLWETSGWIRPAYEYFHPPARGRSPEYPPEVSHVWPRLSEDQRQTVLDNQEAIVRLLREGYRFEDILKEYK